jgi:1,4-dihydroxy-2-naphthoate octaprenyltransferase
VADEDRTPTAWRVWWLAARPKTLWAAAVPVVIGGALAVGRAPFHAPAFFAALFGALMIQVGTNFANDLFDCLKEADRADRLGPARATQRGWVTPAAMRRATGIAFGLAFLAGLYLVARAGAPIAVIGILSILFGVLYTAGPLPLGYIGLGDPFVLVFFGPVAVGGTCYAVALDIDGTVIALGLAPGMLSTAILTVNNLRDIESDRASGKRTLAVRFGARFARAEYLLMTVGGILLPALLLLPASGHRPAAISAFALVAALPPIRAVLAGATGEALNEVLAATGRVLAVFGALLSIGWLL